jgi:hypothetical protein
MAKKINDIGNMDYLSEEIIEEIVPNVLPAETAETVIPARMIYVGPNVPGGALQRFQVFKGGLPPYCEDLIRENPEIRGLFVPVEELETVRRKIEEPGTNEARLFYAVQKKLVKGVK